jgi:hypothetical protein
MNEKEKKEGTKRRYEVEKRRGVKIKKLREITVIKQLCTELKIDITNK